MGHSLSLKEAARGHGPGLTPSTLGADTVSATSFPARAPLSLPRSPPQTRTRLGFRGEVSSRLGLGSYELAPALA